LKDFSEEYVGEIDSSGTDLNVTFSIVGENPSDVKENPRAKKEAIKKLATNVALTARNLAIKTTQKPVTLI
jgi:hypothetical protein